MDRWNLPPWEEVRAKGRLRFVLLHGAKWTLVIIVCVMWWIGLLGSGPLVDGFWQIVAVAVPLGWVAALAVWHWKEAAPSPRAGDDARDLPETDEEEGLLAAVWCAGRRNGRFRSGLVFHAIVVVMAMAAWSGVPRHRLVGVMFVLLFQGAIYWIWPARGVADTLLPRRSLPFPEPSVEVRLRRDGHPWFLRGERAAVHFQPERMIVSIAVPRGWDLWVMTAVAATMGVVLVPGLDAPALLRPLAAAWFFFLLTRLGLPRSRVETAEIANSDVDQIEATPAGIVVTLRSGEPWRRATFAPVAGDAYAFGVRLAIAFKQQFPVLAGEVDVLRSRLHAGPDSPSTATLRDRADSTPRW